MLWLLQINSILIFVIYLFTVFFCGYFFKKVELLLVYFRTLQYKTWKISVRFSGKETDDIWLIGDVFKIWITCSVWFIFSFYTYWENNNISHLDFQRWENKQILKLRKSHILGSFSYRKFLMFARKKIRKFLQYKAHLFLKTVLKIIFWNDFSHIQIWITALYAIFVRKKSMYLRTWGGSFKSANHKQGWVRKFAELICGPPTSVDIINAEHAVLSLNYEKCSSNFIKQFF
jgi:hypothetical protein